MTMLDDQNSETQTARLLKRKGEKTDLGKPAKKSKHCRASKAKWTPEEDEILTRAVMMSGEGNWKKIAQALHDRSHLQCLHRWQKVLNPALVKGPWKEEEDAKLTELVEKYGPKDWSTIAGHIPGRIGKQCRERWFNHLSPDVRKTNWTPEEDQIIIDAHSKIGNKWTNISKLLDGRPANAIKNHWNSTLLKRIQDSNGEPTPRRDRTRNKKPAPLRATEFDFRTQFQHPHDDSSDCSPHQYQHLSPVSSPEAHYQEQSMVNAARFHYPETPHHVFFNPFNDHSNTIVPIASSVWDSWPAPNVIHLTHPVSASLPLQPAVAPSHNTNIGILANNPSASMSGFNGFSHNILGAMNNTYDSNTEPGLAFTSESSSPEDFLDIYSRSSGAVQSNPLPAELQLCFDYPQQTGSGISLDAFTPLTVDSSGMNVSNLSVNLNNMSGVNSMSNMGFLNLDMPGFCPLDI